VIQLYKNLLYMGGVPQRLRLLQGEAEGGFPEEPARERPREGASADRARRVRGEGDRGALPAQEVQGPQQEVLP